MSTITKTEETRIRKQAEMDDVRERFERHVRARITRMEAELAQLSTDAELEAYFASDPDVQNEFSSADAFVAYLRHCRHA